MSGLLNKVVADNTTQLVGVVPGDPGSYGSLNILFINPTNDQAEVQAWLTTSALPAAVDAVIPPQQAPSKGLHETACRIVSAGEKLFIKAPVGVVVRAEIVQEI